MEAQDILRYSEDENIFRRGVKYYENDYIVNFNKTEDNKIIAYSLGSGPNKRYKIEISLGNNDIIKHSECTCLYNREGFVCKHIVAALLYYIRRFSMKNPIINDKEYFKEDKIIRTERYQIFSQFVKEELEENSKLFKLEKNEDTERN
ncbi:MAG: SWIM zinc finger family protein [bacterium]|nr:SWIM zinc finger family protein [bacterium]